VLHRVYGDEKRGRQEAYKDGMWFLGNVLGNEEAASGTATTATAPNSAPLNNVVPTAGPCSCPTG
jgi:hypothetical protein